MSVECEIDKKSTPIVDESKTSDWQTAETLAVQLEPEHDNISEISYRTAAEAETIPLQVLNFYGNDGLRNSSLSEACCRNCWDSTGDLITPCHCAGTNGFVHRECLEAWLRQSGLRECNVCGGKFPLICRLKPLKEWKFLPSCDHRVILFVGLTFTTLFLIGWLLYGIVTTLLRESRDEIDITHYTISFVWLGVIVITWIPLFLGTRKHLLQTYRNWLHQNQVIFVDA